VKQYTIQCAYEQTFVAIFERVAHEVAAHGILYHLSIYPKLSSVVAVKAIFGRYPNQSLFILIDMVYHTARQLVIGGKQPIALRFKGDSA
jgi:hypothetical protein